MEETEPSKCLNI